MKPIFPLLAALLIAPLAASTAEPSQQTCRITNGTLAVTVSQRDAGAVCSLVYDGQEFVNDHDHGRQLQVAWFYDGHGEAYNPTEAGSDSDGTGAQSSSRLLSVNVDGPTLQTQCHPAFWRNLFVVPIVSESLRRPRRGTRCERAFVCNQLPADRVDWNW